MISETTRIEELVAFLYGDDDPTAVNEKITAVLNQYQAHLPPPQPNTLTQQDAVLITYGDMVQAPDEAPLATLTRFCRQQLGDTVNTIHLLPFYPYTSDDGFSVVDYTAVNPTLGTWEDIQHLGQDYALMFDAVINHISASSDWFKRFLADDPHYRDYFVAVDPTTDLSAVFRPRALPLLTPFDTAVGPRYVWTTFSADQIDLNYANPDVLLAVLETLLCYVQRGATLIRLDAIGFLWKEIGTNCLHLPQTHAVIQLIRAALNQVAPQVKLITETNVPHAENIAYFGDGHNEAQMVYNFSLPPLTLHAFHTSDATRLTRWAKTLDLPSDKVTFFNFLASHDGIGLTPARGILSTAEIDQMTARVQALGGRVSFKNNPDGTQSPYELNINYLAALGQPEVDEPTAVWARRFLAAQAIMLALRGVPGIYFHSLFGSDNWTAGVAQTGQNRTINRQKLSYESLTADLADPASLRAQVYRPYQRLLRVRRTHGAFHPHGRQKILAVHPALFALWRGAPA
ncbi:MAG: sugar phosphorylase, partial [Anaerolineales bacterium]|nr:sugar phosphorylase [Anaerolineales bacterium]